jgi:response regulator of citrate/malate metabolism
MENNTLVLGELPPTMGQDRGESGQYTEQTTLDDVIRVFKTAEVPVLTTSEVAEKLSCSQPTAYKKLEQLVKENKLRKKKVGSRAAVYIRLD